MTVLIVTDNYFFLQGLREVVDIFCYVSEKKKRNDAFFPHVSSDDWIILSFSSLDDLHYFYHYYRRNSRARVVICLGFTFSAALTEINNVFFLSADASVTEAENIFSGRRSFARKRYLTRREEIMVSLMVRGLGPKEISTMLALSIKTVSLHKNHISEKSGLMLANDIALLSLMRFIPLSDDIENNHNIPRCIQQWRTAARPLKKRAASGSHSR